MSDRLFVGGFEDRKLKRKIEEPSIMDTDSEFSLTLSLGGNKMVGESSSKLTLDSLKVHGDSSFAPKPVKNSNDNEVIMPNEQKFSCKFCDRKFSSSQALGGHQNAHKRQRILSKMEKEFAVNTFGLGAHPCPYPATENHLPFCGAPLYHRAQMHHPHMSTMPWCHFGLGCGNQGMYNTSFSGHQFGMMSNFWGTSAKAQQRLNRMGVRFDFEVGQVPSPVGDAVNRSTIACADLEALQENHYTGNQQFSSSGPNLSFNL